MTGKRGFKPRPKAEWYVEDRPDLAIVSREEFDAVQGLLAAKASQIARTKDGKLKGRKKGSTFSTAPLSGLLKCGKCGGQMGLVGGKKNRNTGLAYRQYRCCFSKRRGAATCT